MPKRHSSSHIIKTIEANGFYFVCQKGSHAKYRKFENGKVITVIVPTPDKEIPVGTFRSIVRQSKLNVSDF